jgi:hypothetical protein
MFRFPEIGAQQLEDAVELAAVRDRSASEEDHRG